MNTKPFLKNSRCLSEQNPEDSSIPGELSRISGIFMHKKEEPENPVPPGNVLLLAVSNRVNPMVPVFTYRADHSDQSGELQPIDT